MRIRPTDILFGLPALELRRLLQRVDAWDSFDMETVREVAPMSRNAAKRLLADLGVAGYVEYAVARDSRGPAWQLSIRGRALSMASAARPIRRATADRLLYEFLDRVDAVNADACLGYRVTEVVVFGSYLGSDSTLGDVDVGVRLESRLSPNVDPVAHGAARVDLAKKCGRVFRSWFDELTWSYKEVWLRLKWRSRGLSRHDLDKDGIFELGDLELRVLYRDGRRVQASTRYADQ
jgi:predicted nucleotidyltransferase